MRNLFNPIGVGVVAAILSLGLMRSAVAESEGAYVHGAARIGDQKVYFCHRLDIAVHIARRFNAAFAGGYTDEKFVKSGLAAEIEFGADPDNRVLGLLWDLCARADLATTNKTA